MQAARRRAGSGSARRGLSPARIVDVALALVEREGLQGLTARRLGNALGVEAMSIYHHFPSKRHLLDALVDRALASVAWPPATLPPVEQIRAIAHGWRAMAHAHRRLYPLIAVHRLNTLAGVRFIERVLEVIDRAIPDRERSARFFRAFGYYLMGALLDETSGYAQGPSAAEPATDDYIATNCPRLAQAAPFFRQPHWAATFELGLTALIGEIGRERPSRATRAGKRAEVAGRGGTR